MGTGTRNKRCIKITFYLYSCCVTLSCEEFQTTHWMDVQRKTMCKEKRKLKCDTCALKRYQKFLNKETETLIKKAPASQQIKLCNIHTIFNVVNTVCCAKKVLTVQDKQNIHVNLPWPHEGSCTLPKSKIFFSFCKKIILFFKYLENYYFSQNLMASK